MNVRFNTFYFYFGMVEAYYKLVTEDTTVLWYSDKCLCHKLLESSVRGNVYHFKVVLLSLHSSVHVLMS